MAAGNTIRSYSYTFASDETGLQREFYSGGSARFADISYAIDAGKTLQVLHGEEKLGFPSSYSTFIYQSETNTLLVYTCCRRQVMAGRVISCGQVIVYNLKDVLNGADYLQALFGTSFLSEDGIQRSGDMKHAQVVRPNADYTPVVLSALSDSRKRTLAAVVSRLMGGKQVVLRLPVSKNYEEQSLEVLQQIMTMIPQRDRCEFSFATACKEADVKNLRRVNLILSDTDEPDDTFADWIDLDDPPALNDSDDKWLRWCNENEDVRYDVEHSAFFADKEYSSEVPRRALFEDKSYLEEFYDPALSWWRKKPLEPRFRSLDEFRKELRYNPTLSVKRYRCEFLQEDTLQSMIDIPTGLGACTSGFRPSEALREKVRTHKFGVLIYEDVFFDKKEGKYRFAGSDKWNSGTAFDQFTEELTAPFYISQKDKKIAEGGVNGVSYAQIVQQITDMIEDYKNF